MNSSKSTCPPLTTDDILILRGNPMAKRIEPLKKSFSARGGSPPAVGHGAYGGNPAIEEWIYYKTPTNAKESYVFKNGTLIGYKTE
jgi:hypothetical protein